MDALICAIKMLVGQMQAEAEVRYLNEDWNAWIVWQEPGVTKLPEYKARTAALEAAKRRAAGLRTEAD